MTSKAPNGSSNKRISALHKEVLKKAALWRIPPERLEGYAFSYPERPNVSNSFKALCFIDLS